MTRVSPPHSGVGPPTSKGGSGTSCQPMGKAPPIGLSSSWDKAGSGTDNCLQLGPASPVAEPTSVRFPPLWGEGVGGRSSKGSSEEEAALRAPYSHLAPSLVQPALLSSLPASGSSSSSPGWGELFTSAAAPALGGQALAAL